MITAAEATDTVLATITYAERGDVPLHQYYLVDPPQGVAAFNEVPERHEMEIANLREIPGGARLDVHGFELLPFTTTVKDIYDAAQRRGVFDPEAAAFVKRVTGAREVRLFAPFLRGDEASRRIPGSITAPAGAAHVDYAADSGDMWFDIVLGPDAARFAGADFAIINLWRPIVGPLRDHPLAVCDSRTVAPEDLLSTRTISRIDKDGLTTPDGEIYETRLYAVGHNPAHRWFYAPDMMPDEALLLKNYDSRTSGVSRFCPHTAFTAPSLPPPVPPRASIEVRCLTIW